MHGYDALSPGGGFLSGPAPAPSKPVKVLLRASTTMAPGWPGFFAWLAVNQPVLYSQIRVRYPNLSWYNQYTNPSPIMSGLGDSLTPIDVTAQLMPTTPAPSSGGWASDIASALTSLAPTVIATVDQQKIFNTQLSRAQNGLPPLNTTSYGLPSMSGALSTLTSPLILVLGLGGLFLFAGRRRKA